MPNLEDFLLRLGLCRGRRNRAADSKNDREPDHLHGHLVEDGLGGSLAERRDAHQQPSARVNHDPCSG
jgi:hypothetical protein